MRLLETSKFQKLRKKLKDEEERDSLKNAALQALENPEAGKKLKGEFRDLRALLFAVREQARRLIYKHEKDTVVLFSFGPRQGIYK